MSTREDRLGWLADEFRPMDDPREFGTPARFALVERSTIDASTYVTTHETLDDAGTYWGMQEEPADWAPVVVVDLDSGERHVVEEVHLLRIDDRPLPHEFDLDRIYAAVMENYSGADQLAAVYEILNASGRPVP